MSRGYDIILALTAGGEARQGGGVAGLFAQQKEPVAESLSPSQFEIGSDFEGYEN